MERGKEEDKKEVMANDMKKVGVSEKDAWKCGTRIGRPQ